MSEQENENKEIEVVKGDGSELEFSPVYEHLNAAKPKPKDEKKKNIIIKYDAVSSSCWNSFIFLHFFLYYDIITKTL